MSEAALPTRFAALVGDFMALAPPDRVVLLIELGDDLPETVEVAGYTQPVDRHLFRQRSAPPEEIRSFRPPEQGRELRVPDQHQRRLHGREPLPADGSPVRVGLHRRRAQVEREDGLAWVTYSSGSAR